MGDRRSRFEALAICLAAVWSTVVSRHVILDDGAIVERYLDQLLAGHGWVWNTGENRNALTSFTHPVLVLLVAEVTRNVGFATHLVGGIGLALAGLACWRLLRAVGTPVAALLCGIAVPVFPPLTSTWGLETGLYVAGLATLPLLAGRKLGAAAAFVVLTRPDGVIGAGVALVRDLARTRRLRWPQLALAGTPVAAWLAWQKLRFGLWLPASVGVKQQQGATASGGFTYTAGWKNELLRLCNDHHTLTWTLAGVGFAGLVCAVLSRKWPLVEFTGFVLAQQTAFALVPVPSYRWYYVPFLVDGLLLVGYAAETAARAVAARARVAAALAVATGLAAAGWFVSTTPRQSDQREREFALVDRQIHLSPGQVVAGSEIGVLGADLPTTTPVLDISGLATSPVLSLPQNRHLFWEHPPADVVFHWFRGPVVRAPVTRVAAAYEAQSGLRVDGGRDRRDATGLPPGAPFGSEAPFLTDPRFFQRYQLTSVVALPGPYASLLLFTTRPSRGRTQP